MFPVVLNQHLKELSGNSEESFQIVCILSDIQLYALQLLTINPQLLSTFTHHPKSKSTLSTTKFHYPNTNPCNFHKYGADTSLDREQRSDIVRKRTAGDNRCSPVKQRASWAKTQSKNYESFSKVNHFLPSMCPRAPDLRVKMWPVALSGSVRITPSLVKTRHLTLSAHYSMVLSAGQSDAEAPWWIQACRGEKSVSSGVRPYIQSADTSIHTHPSWKMFPWVTSVSLCSTNSLVIICRGRKNEHLLKLALR